MFSLDNIVNSNNELKSKELLLSELSDYSNLMKTFAAL
jgi:hypothetical protein